MIIGYLYISEIILPDNECLLSFEYSYTKDNKHCIIIEIKSEDNISISDLYYDLLFRINRYVEYQNNDIVLYNKIIYKDIIYHLDNLIYYISYSINKIDIINNILNDLNKLNIK